MARRTGLGRGLGALIPTEETTTAEQDPAGEGAGAGALLRQLPVSAISPNPNQPRRNFDDGSLAELTASVQTIGVLQPVLVREVAPDTYELVAGERRWRAAKAAGLQAIPAVVRSVDETGSLEQALVENLHRDDLNPLEEAAAYQQLVDEFGMTQEQVAERVGRSRAAVANTIRLLQLPAAVQRAVESGQLSAGHGRALLGTRDRRFQEELGRRAVAEALTVRQVEEAVRDRVGAPAADEPDPKAGASPVADSGGRKGVGPSRPAALLELERLLSEHLETRVSVQLGSKKGRIEIEFADIEDLERIYHAMAG